MDRQILLAHPSGNMFFRAAARAFLSAGWLKELHSSICWDEQHPLAQRLPPKLTAQLARRSFPDVPLSLQRSHPWRELGRLMSADGPLPWLRRHEQGPFSVDAVYHSFDRHVAARLPALPGLTAVYAYEDAALRTFQAAQSLGIRRLYDLPIGHWRAAQQIFQEEKDLNPEWACTLTGLKDSPAKLARKDQELALADLVIVPSAFVRSTLLAHQATTAPIALVPFGSPPPLAALPTPPPAGPLRVLYVGSLGQRKGLSYALEAIHALGSQVSLTLIGRPTSKDCTPLMAALQRHRWIESLPHPQILEQMRQHDVLLLPSLFEGYALVISEALSQSLPVITTANSGGTTSVRDGIEGFIVPIRSSAAIAERLQQLADNRDQLAAMGQACLHRAADLSWAGYEQGLRCAVSQTLQAATHPA
ncbi:MAG: glycosyltransferase family 4 protein [Cyanobium sp.]